ncbi:hypothetical protein [Comamonas sp. B-9]|uniref:hypothetical protein n=1 Tax=Comamonas sp. B-9 TaxID=1055192 RepID=UPI0011DDBC0E|nr:hypothetical protein [Comamonas sp. B-9]
MDFNTNELIDNWHANAENAAYMLHSNELMGQCLVVMYASIDAMGLLNAANSVDQASSETFKTWVKDYLLPNGKFRCNEMDLWAARCGILHTFTSGSNLSAKGAARQIQYYGSQDWSEQYLKKLDSIASDTLGEAAVFQSSYSLYDAYIVGLGRFANDLKALCKQDVAKAERMKRVLGVFAVKRNS